MGVVTGIPPDNEYRDSQRRHARWGIAVQDYVGGDLFRYVQFRNNDEDVMYGSSIQKVVCKACGVPEDGHLEFWTNVCNETVKKSSKERDNQLQPASGLNLRVSKSSWLLCCVVLCCVVLCCVVLCCVVLCCVVLCCVVLCCVVLCCVVLELIK